MAVGKKDKSKLEKVLSFLQKSFTMKDKLLMEKPRAKAKSFGQASSHIKATSKQTKLQDMVNSSSDRRIFH